MNDLCHEAAELENSMDGLMRVKPGRTAAIAVLVTAMLAAGCALEGDVDNSDARNQQCPRNMTIQCTRRSAEPERCLCVRPGAAERVIDDAIGSY